MTIDDQNTNTQESMDDFYARKEMEKKASMTAELEYADRRRGMIVKSKPNGVEQHMQTIIGIFVVSIMSWMAFQFNDISVLTARMDERTRSSNELAKTLKTTLDLYHETMVTKEDMMAMVTAYRAQATTVNALTEEKIRAINTRVIKLENKIFGQ